MHQDKSVCCRLIVSIALLAAIWPAALLRADAKSNDVQDAQVVLEKRLPELRFDKVGFGDVVDFLSDVTDANLFVDWKALEATGVNRQAPISARLRNVPFKAALDLILKDASNGKVELAWMIKDNVIVISTATDLQKNVVVRVYDVRFLAAARKNAPATQPSTQPAEPQDPLLRIFYGSVVPKSWNVNGGTGDIKELNDTLVVSATEENQALVGNLLDSLKRMMGEVK